MISIFPAILIGGPPHAGKSTLTYRLRDAFHKRRVSHYVLRAPPDGEGNWTVEAPRAITPELRRRAKRTWQESTDLAKLASRDIAARHLPLLVDVGGVVSPENEMIAAQCTHAIVLSADPAKLPAWRELVAQQGLALIAELHSDLHGAPAISDDGAVLRGVIAGLEPAMSSEGVCFDALIERVAQICAYEPDELFREHQDMTDVELVLHVERAIFPLPEHSPRVNDWRPDELPALIGSLPPETPLGIYGIGPGWLYAALSAASAPARVVTFDPRLGWVDPPPLTFADAPDPARLRWSVGTNTPGVAHVQFDIPGAWLDYDTMAGTPIPRVEEGRGVVLDGKLPHWLNAALVRAYCHAPWVALYYPPIHRAVVVLSRDPAVALGSVREVEVS
jgi:CRISPR-associated protein Csx3